MRSSTVLSEDIELRTIAQYYQPSTVRRSSSSICTLSRLTLQTLGCSEKNRLDQLTGFEEKHLFQTWCFYHRFPALSDYVHRYQPKVVIGTGVSYLREFFACLGGSPASAEKIACEEISPASGSNSQRSRRFYWVPVGERTLLFVIPFFSGPSGLNSNFLLQEMGERIREISGIGS